MLQYRFGGRISCMAAAAAGDLRADSVPLALAAASVMHLSITTDLNLA
jgi:hypothetical protein